MRRGRRTALSRIQVSAAGASLDGLVVVTATDRHYVELVGVMLMSLAEQARGAVAAIHVFGTGLTEADRRRIAACYPDAGRLNIHDIDNQSRALLSRMKVRTHITPAGYARLLIPRLLPQVEGRMLYVDCDVLINGDLAPLAALDMEGLAVAAVEDRRDAAHAEWNRRLGLPEDTPYLNSGVLLIDPVRWRAEGLTEKSCAVAIEKADRIRMMDQDALNAALAGHWLKLPREWNYYESSFAARQCTDPSGFQAARIIHFVGRAKPNHADCRHPMTDLYRAYRARSPWAHAPLHDPIRRNIRVYAAETVRRLIRRGRALFARRPAGGLPTSGA